MPCKGACGARLARRKAQTANQNIFAPAAGVLYSIASTFFFSSMSALGLAQTPTPSYIAQEPLLLVSRKTEEQRPAPPSPIVLASNATPEVATPGSSPSPAFLERPTPRTSTQRPTT
ncbi:hypothetical protein BDK51DRAFT_49147 [Blyttiomyces helicus]|uniref:Uncharacterized protein n=1 Tax=Blyttiomyces helicus TaxID=388810 RepID=A0A4P9W8G7_9FUNG|nr:hypothetical protein BDK51DRAFT_49147 [Blyttiomyces helicus]|eukprot:RKO88819.1 hypothetical protein BDK51DRAFT_49147 [Blyttiomyces helicus]